MFLVHGHNQRWLQECARLIERLGLKLTVLHEQPNQGRTIIEKFVDHAENADIGFAVVLMTADDRGGTLDAPYEKQQFRARQNVVLELGFFLGTLGRHHVCALYQAGVELPSDYDGVLFISLEGPWQLQLAKEMKAAGLPVDLNLMV